MAKSNDQSLKEVVVKIGSESEKDSASNQINEPTRRRSKELLDGKKVDIGGGEAAEGSSKASCRRKPVFFSQSKSRLEDSYWMHNRKEKDKETKRDEVWFLDDDFLRDITHLKKIHPLTIAQWASLLLIMAILACTLSIVELKQLTLWDLPLWKWEILILVIICGHLVSGWGIRFIVCFIERSFILKIRVLYFVYGMRKSVQNCIWLGVVLLSWYLLVMEEIQNKANRSVLKYVTKILLCLLVGTLVWLVKTLVVKVLASSFHVSAFFDRIKDSLLKQYVIKKLKEKPLYDEESDQDEEKVASEAKNSSKLLKGDSSSSNMKEESAKINHLQKLTKKNVSSLRMKRMISLVQSGFISDLSTIEEDLPEYSSDDDEATVRTKDECEARILAKRIFQNVAQDKKYIHTYDLKRYIRRDKVDDVMKLFEGVTRGGISETAFTSWMIDAVRERRTIAMSLDDTKTAVDDLHRMFNVVVSLIIVIIWLILFGVSISHFLILISSQVLVVVFVFGNTCKTTFEAIIFLFVMHPYDVGDRCEIDGVQMEVHEMNILTTVFLRFDQQVIIYPNSVLATKPIGNYFRSPGMGDQVEFSIHISTPWKKIDTIKERIIGYIQNHSEEWFPDPTVIVKDVEDMNRLCMVVWPRHRMNHQKMGDRWKRRAKLVEEMIRIFCELDVEYRMLPVDMNLCVMPSLTSERLPSIWRTCAG